MSYQKVPHEPYPPPGYSSPYPPPGYSPSAPPPPPYEGYPLPGAPPPPPGYPGYPPPGPPRGYQGYFAEGYPPPPPPPPGPPQYQQCYHYEHHSYEDDGCSSMFRGWALGNSVYANFGHNSVGVEREVCNRKQMEDQEPTKDVRLEDSRKIPLLEGKHKLGHFQLQERSCSLSSARKLILTIVLSPSLDAYKQDRIYSRTLLLLLYYTTTYFLASKPGIFFHRRTSIEPDERAYEEARQVKYMAALLTPKGDDVS
ncbi:unnamed protein product [Dovyalis caffra]|uniref:Uncharacterized protein n=1 Tax=Dovyalis caffra TaxID=77055 RepID=A0AAV1R3P8_9ROSI|nr:unnamed protein product [Dovyalis caffra]